MAVLIVMDMPGVTQADYEAVNARLTAGQGNPTKETLPVAGLINHAAGPTADGWIVVDTWESEADFAKFGEVIGPIIADLGLQGRFEPRVVPVFHQIV